MDNLEQQLEEIRQARPALYQLIMSFINGDIPGHEIDEFLALSAEERKVWLVEQAKRLGVAHERA